MAEKRPESRWGMAAWAIASIPIAMELILRHWVDMGVRENEGAGELFGWTLVAGGTLCPLAILLAIVGLFRHERRHTASFGALGFVIVFFLILRSI